MDFTTAISRTLGLEGGYVNNPKDPGGETNFGITWPVLRQAIALGIVPAGTTIANLTQELAAAIYHVLFWQRVNADEMIDPLQFQALDFAVNSGIGVAVRKLQLAAGVADDGHWGPVTKAAVNGTNPGVLLLLFIAARQEYQTKLSNWASAGKGWAMRNVTDMRYAAQDLGAWYGRSAAGASA